MLKILFLAGANPIFAAPKINECVSRRLDAVQRREAIGEFRRLRNEAVAARVCKARSRLILIPP